jgi:hypothetical protein
MARDAEPQPNEEADAEDVHSGLNGYVNTQHPSLGGIDWPFTIFDLIGKDADRRYDDR